MKIIMAGSEGLLGAAIAEDLETHCCVQYQEHEVVRLDKALGHDLTSEKCVRAVMRHHAPNTQVLINTFALNPQPDSNSYNVFDLPLDTFREYCEVNGTALFSVCRSFAEFAPYGAKIINFSSAYGVVSPDPRLYSKGIKHPAYTYTKAGVIGLSKWLAVHLAPRTIVYCLAPGGIENAQPQDFLTLYSSRTPMQRLGKKQEIVELVRFLVEKAPAYLTGALIPIDGGFTCW